ncbi:MAG: hypothetical protein V1859_01120 [archaeon]
MNSLDKNSKWLWIIPIFAVIAIAAIIGNSIFRNISGTQENHGLCPRMIPNYTLWLSLILMIIIIVPVSYYVISKRLEEKMEKSLNAITKLIDHKIIPQTTKEDNGLGNKGNILKFLNSNEKRVIETVINNKGSALQSEISRVDGMTKLKAHRAVKELERKGIINLEPYGKTNRITLSKNIKDII